MLRVLAALTLLLTSIDHWTTYQCLRSPVPGWTVSEANPMADWLFAATGLVPGLLIDSAVTLLAVAFLLSTGAIPHRAKLGFLSVISIFTSYAVVNNIQAIQAMGLDTVGVG
jgi:hypothetical protein